MPLLSYFYRVMDSIIWRRLATSVSNYLQITYSVLQHFVKPNRNMRHYIRKTNRASYSKETLTKAVKAVQNGDLSGYKAAAKYNIPRSTIMKRIYHPEMVISTSLGRGPCLKRENETIIARSLKLMERNGFRLTRKEIIQLVSDYVKQNDIINPFRNNIPGSDWYANFKRRHDIHVNKKREPEQKNACNPFIIYPYLSTLKHVLDKLNLHNEPDLIWNVGIKSLSCSRTSLSSENDITTVLLGFNVKGQKTPPLIVNKGKYVRNEWVSEQDYPGTVYAATTSGSMETAVFETFFDYIFLPTIGERRPVLLIYDGQTSHIGISVIEKARKANVTIVKIPPHTSYVLHPLELAVNEWIEEGWDEALAEWKKLHTETVLPKQGASKIIGKIWTSIEAQFCAKGFQMAGISPYNKDVISEDMFESSYLRNWKNRNLLGEWDSVEIFSTEVSNNSKSFPLDIDLDIKLEQETSLILSEDQLNQIISEEH